MDSMGEEERARAGVVKLTPIVALDSFHHSTKLCVNMREEVCQCGKGVGFNV